MKLKSEISKSKNNVPSKKNIQNVLFEELDSLINNFGKSPLSISKNNFQSTEKNYEDETINNFGKINNIHYQKEESKSHIINNRRVSINNNTNNAIKEDKTITFKDNSIKNDINSQIKNKFDIDLIQINNENLNKNHNLNKNFKENIPIKNNDEFISAINLNQINNQKRDNFTLVNNFNNKNINNGILNSLNNISMTININNNISSSNKKSKDSFSLSSIDLDSYFDNLESIKKIKQNPSKKCLSSKKNYLENFPLNLIIKYPNLNKVQESCFDLLFYTNENSLITAPTGSGKTLLFEISLARIIKENFNLNKNSFNNKNFKIIYIAPIKSLCQEKTFDWKIKFCQNPLNLNILEFTSDNEYINFTQLNEANLILTTPEKFDVLSRKWKKIPEFFLEISLLLIDEIHLLNEENRGATIEAIVSRMKLISSLKRFQNSFIENFRIIALSATIPNIYEIAEFLNVKKSGLKIFGEEFRPVKIERIVLGYQRGKNQNEYMFEKYLDYRIANLIQNYSEGKSSLIFCQTQKGTINCAKQLVNDFNLGKLTSISSLITKEDKKKLENLSFKISNKNLSQCIKYGIAFHNGGLNSNDRNLIENNFKDNLIKIICTTSTLAQGVNLPARLVIIKSTNCYRGNKIGYSEYNKIEIDQMIGRAGRIQFEKKGIAIIMTEKEKVEKFSELSYSLIESHLKENIVEHINAEIASGIIVDVDSALNWVKNTFMYVRMKNNPAKFGIKFKLNNQNKNEEIFNFIKEMIFKIFNDLKLVDLIKFDETNLKVVPKKLCKKMSKNYVKFDTMKQIYLNLEKEKEKTYWITGEQIEENIIEMLSKSKEFLKYSSKMEERKILNQLNKEMLNGIKYKVKGSVDTNIKKSYVLIQSEISGIVLDNWELRRQQNEISQISQRILKCIRGYYKTIDDCKGYIVSLILSKCLLNQMWSESELIMKQLPKIGEKLAKCFVKANYKSFSKLIELNNPILIENICNKNPPFGNILLDEIKSIPKINFKYDITNYKKNKNKQNFVKISLCVTVLWEKFIKDNKNESDYFDTYSPYHIIMSDNSGDNRIKFCKKIRPNSFNKPSYLYINDVDEKQFPINFYIICDKFIGLDQIITVKNIFDLNGTIISSEKGNLKSIVTIIHRYVKNNVSNENISINKILNDEEVEKMINEESKIKLEKSETKNKKLNIDNYFSNIRKRKKKKAINNKLNESTSVDSNKNLNKSFEDYGNHPDLMDMINNMKTEHEKKMNNQKNLNENKNNGTTNLKITQIKKYLNKNDSYDKKSELETNFKTHTKNKNIENTNNSTQNLMEHLNKISEKGINLNLDILDNLNFNENNNNENDIIQEKNEEHFNKIFSLNDIF
jgi:ATP-dependent DNA helicase HFM1/MER3